jgi:hypothetical protein
MEETMSYRVNSSRGFIPAAIKEMFPDVESRIGKEKDWAIGTYTHTAMESNVTIEWVNVCSGSTQILTVYFYINDIDVTGAGGKPLRKSRYLGNFLLCASKHAFNA